MQSIASLLGKNLLNNVKKAVNPLVAAAFVAGSLTLAPPLQDHAHAIMSGHAHKSSSKRSAPKRSTYRKKSKYRSSTRSSRRYQSSKNRRKASKKHRKKYAAKPIPPQNYINQLSKLTLKPGLVFRFYRGPLVINIVEVDMRYDNLAVRPYLASHNFDKLKTVKEHSEESGAIVTVNANYFKKDGTPLGALKMDGEWISGSLFNRVAMGITKDKEVLFAPVNLHGILKTSNPKAKSLWVNNMNQPRIHGAKLILYTKRWGDSVTLPYEGILVGVNKHGQVVDIHPRAMKIPRDGFVLTDKKESRLRHLVKGDFAHLTWHTSPKNWNKVEHAISGGPTLIRDGRLYVGLKAEKFNPSWTSSKITHRTACGFTSDKRLIIATVEGSHNMWDLAKFMQHLGCVDAMNLDGGGSTTMVVNGTTVTRNGNFGQGYRKVATSLIVLDPMKASLLARQPDKRYHPSLSNLTDFNLEPGLAVDQFQHITGVKHARAQQSELKLLTGQKISNIEQIEALDNSPNQETAPISHKRDGQNVIDIDDDLTEGPAQEEDKRLKTFYKKRKYELKKMKKRDKEAELGSTKTKRWSTKLLKPFSFKHKEG